MKPEKVAVVTGAARGIGTKLFVSNYWRMDST